MGATREHFFLKAPLCSNFPRGFASSSACHFSSCSIFFEAGQSLHIPRCIAKAMEDYEMKNGAGTTAYDVDAERVVNPTEDNDLVQIGYKPELEVCRGSVP